MGSIKIESGPKFPPKQVRRKLSTDGAYPSTAVSSLTNLCHKFCAELGSVGQWRALLNTKGTKWSLADACCATAWAETTRRRRPPFPLSPSPSSESIFPTSATAKNIVQPIVRHTISLSHLTGMAGGAAWCVPRFSISRGD